MCKYFANGFSCKWMEKYDECKYVHDQDVRNAFKAFLERHKAGQGLTNKELREKLDPDNKHDDIDLRIKKYLYIKYPRPLTKKRKTTLIYRCGERETGRTTQIDANT